MRARLIALLSRHKAVAFIIRIFVANLLASEVAILLPSLFNPSYFPPLSFLLLLFIPLVSCLIAVEESVTILRVAISNYGTPYFRQHGMPIEGLHAATYFI